jgi:hypothetical protein
MFPEPPHRRSGVLVPPLVEIALTHEVPHNHIVLGRGERALPEKTLDVTTGQPAVSRSGEFEFHGEGLLRLVYRGKVKGVMRAERAD